MLFLIFGLTFIHVLPSTVSAECLDTESCEPIRSCRPIIEKLKRVRQTQDSEKRDKIITEVQSKICGPHKDKLICCPTEQDLQQQQQQQQQPEQEAVFVGEFINIFHDIEGQVYKLSDTQLLIKNFNYDGEGPDAFFLAGASGTKPKSRTTDEDIVLPYPYTGRHYEYLDNDIPILGGFNRDKDIVLTLPPGITTNQLRWLSVWCRDYKVNFGHATFNN